MTNSWRENLKSGPFGRLYQLVRKAKRLARREPLTGTVELPPEALGVNELLALAPVLTGHGRYYYSLALAYLDVEAGSEPANVEIVRWRKALACLRCAETFQFEAKERIAVYKALIYARMGDFERAQSLVEQIEPWELDGEAALLETIRAEGAPPLEIALVPRDSGSALLSSGSGIAPVPANSEFAPLPPNAGGLSVGALVEAETDSSSIWEGVKSRIVESSAKSLLVVRDPLAMSSLWKPDVCYLLADASVTGLDLEACAPIGIKFELAVGSLDDQRLARDAGLKCAEWITIPE